MKKKHPLDDLDDDIRDHLERETLENIERGMSPDEARAAARRAFGSVTLVKERTRAVWVPIWLQDLLQDLRYGLRQLRRNPGFAAAAILTLALGIGANTAIFSMLQAVVLRALPVDHPGELVLLSSTASTGQSTGSPPAARWLELPTAAYEYFVDHNESFQGLAAFRSGSSALEVHWPGAHEDAQNQRATGHLVAGSYFQVLGVNAAAGRLLGPGDDTPNAQPATVISYTYWRQHLHGETSAIGRAVDLNGTSFTIVGVAARGFFGERMHQQSPDFWLPLSFQPQVMRRASWLMRTDIYWLNLVARLKPGVTRTQANAVLNVQLRQFLTAQAGAHPSNAQRQAIAHAYVQLDPGATGISMVRQVYGEPLVLLMGLVALVLLVACANVANLLLSRSEARRTEVAIRRAIGAGTARLIRQMLTESLLLAGLGGAAGLLVANWSVHALSPLVTRDLAVRVTTSPTILAFTFISTALTGLIFGLVPAWRFGRRYMGSATIVSSVGRRESWLGGALIAFQIAASLVLLSGAGLLARSFVNLKRQPLGFDAEHVLLVRVDPRLAGLKVGELNGVYRQLMDRLNASPGVTSASIAFYTPMSGYNEYRSATIEGYTPHPNESLSIHFDVIAPRYFATLKIPVLRGRPIQPQDAATSSPVVVVDEAFVDRYLPGQNPIGKHVLIGHASYPITAALPQEIIGVVGNARYNDPAAPPVPMAYIPLSQDPSWYAGELVIRTTGDPNGAAREIRRAIGDVDRALPVVSVKTLEEQVGRQLNQQELMTILSGLFSLLALVLAAVGLSGVLAYWVRRQTAEIGVRLALGAQPRNIVRLVMSRGLTVACAGVGAGLVLAIASTRLLASSLYGVTPNDPTTFAAVCLFVGLVALLACYGPARRASRVDPMVTLRGD
jgi:predicted permease